MRLRGGRTGERGEGGKEGGKGCGMLKSMGSCMSSWGVCMTWSLLEQVVDHVEVKK